MSQLSRRAFLSGILATSVLGCSPMITRLERPPLPDTLVSPQTDAHASVVHLLNRTTYGIRPGQVQQVHNLGARAWLEQQMDWQSIPEGGVNRRLLRFDTLKMNSVDLLSFSSFPDREFVADELALATLVRAVFSPRQLYQVMVEFWSDHFSIYHFKEQVHNLKTVDDREVIRPHALGNFADMLRASAHSPAMLIYLDNVQNEKSHPNENYAREIMELHTLGVDGGYTEDDIKEVARCFTGWSVDERGRFEFIPHWHDDGEKQVLGEAIPAGGGKADGDRVLDILLNHPSTATFVATKLVRRFVADDPPIDVVQRCATALRNTNWDIQAGLWAIFDHPGFATAPPKLKRPFELLTSLLRVTNANYDGNARMLRHLENVGHRPFNHPTPDGYPDTAEAWAGNLLGRWNLAIDTVNSSLPGVRVDLSAWFGQATASDDPITYLGAAFTKRSLSAQEAQAIRAFVQDDPEDMTRIAGAVLASPAFQWK